MNRFALISLVFVLAGPGMAQAQYYTTYYSPATAYYQPSTVYYAPAPTVYYSSPPTTTYYAPAPTTVYYGAAPTTAYYSAAPAVTTYYRPLVGRGITRVGYYSPAVVYPVANTYQAYYPWW